MWVRHPPASECGTLWLSDGDLLLAGRVAAMLRGCRSGQPLPDYDAVARRLHTTGAVDTVPTGSAVSAGLAPDDLQEVDSAPIEVDGSAVPWPAAGWSAVGRAGPGVYLA